jgi:hypothetical protein
MRTTVTLADDVYQAAKTLADGSGKPLGVVLSDLARKGLRPRPAELGQGGLPVFAVPPESEIIPGCRAGELAASEGVE